jgi:methionyl-tRNA formyltransferase
MRIVLMGQAAFGAKTLEALLGKGENVVAVHVPPDRPGAKADPLKEGAAARGIPVFQPRSYKTDEAFEEYKALAPDLTILAFVTAIIPARYFEAATRGAICYHPSILPRHRGGSAINWAVIMGDTRTGLTIFWPDGGIDTGPILLQKEVAIGPADTTGSLYFNHLFPMGIDAIMESVAIIRDDKAPRIPQDEAAATYEPLCDDRVAAIDWARDPQDVTNLIRGCDPQPGAYTIWRGEKLRMYGAGLSMEPQRAEPGTVLKIDDSGIHVALLGARLTIAGVRPGKLGKQAASQWAAEVGLEAGTRLGEP